MNIYCRNEKNYNVHEITVYLDLSILELTKILKYEFWYGYLKLKYGGKANLCYIDRGSFSQKQKKMLKQDLILQIMKLKDQKEKIKE